MFGGYQTNMRTYTEVVTEISRGDGSAGWFVSLSNITRLYGFVRIWRKSIK